MHPTPDFERFRTVVMLEGEPDRVPLSEIIIDGGIKGQFLGRPIRNLADDVEFWYQAGYDYIRIIPGYNFPKQLEQAHGSSINWASEGKGVITSFEDFEKYPWPSIDDIDFSRIEEVGKLLYPGMKLIAGTGGIFEEVWMTMGFEDFSFASIENPDLIEAMYEKVGTIMYQMFERTLEYDHVGAMWLTDDIAYISGVMVSPDHFRKHLFPWYKRIGKMVHERGLPFLYHSDGDLWAVLDDLVDAGFNAIQPIEPKAMDIVEVKAKYGDKLAVIGNVDLGYTLTLGKPEEVTEEVKQKIRDLAPGGGFALGTSNTVTHYVPYENYKAMVDACHEYGKYPITL